MTQGKWDAREQGRAAAYTRCLQQLLSGYGKDIHEVYHSLLWPFQVFPLGVSVVAGLCPERVRITCVEKYAYRVFVYEGKRAMKLHVWDGQTYVRILWQRLTWYWYDPFSTVQYAPVGYRRYLRSESHIGTYSRRVIPAELSRYRSRSSPKVPDPAIPRLQIYLSHGWSNLYSMSKAKNARPGSSVGHRACVWVASGHSRWSHVIRHGQNACTTAAVTDLVDVIQFLRYPLALLKKYPAVTATNSHSACMTACCQIHQVCSRTAILYTFFSSATLSSAYPSYQCFPTAHAAPFTLVVTPTLCHISSVLESSHRVLFTVVLKHGQRMRPQLHDLPRVGLVHV